MIKIVFNPQGSWETITMCSKEKQQQQKTLEIIIDQKY
jgi:hypothetical protein